MDRNLCHPSTGARHFQKSPRVYPSCSRLILETAFALRSEYGRLSPSSRRFGKTRGISRWSGICIFCWFSKTENGWASCSTNQSLRRFSANSPQLRTRFEMRQRPRVGMLKVTKTPRRNFDGEMFQMPNLRQASAAGIPSPLANCASDSSSAATISRSSLIVSRATERRDSAVSRMIVNSLGFALRRCSRTSSAPMG